MNHSLQLSAEYAIRTNSQKDPDVCSFISLDGPIISFGPYDVLLTSKPTTISSLKLITLKIRQRQINGSSQFAFGWLRLRRFTAPNTLRSVLANGLNGWTHSPLLTANDILRAETNVLQKPFGDHDYYHYPEKSGLFHSWSVTYGDCGDNKVAFYGATDERHFYSVFEVDVAEKLVSIAIETTGFDFAHSSAPNVDEQGFTVFGEWIITDPQSNLPDLTAATKLWVDHIAINDPRRKPQIALEHIYKKLGKKSPARGYTSWYYRYTNIDPTWLTANLTATTQQTDWKIFQIDDGYQAAIGDWLTPKLGFPEGISPVLKAARNKGFVPGLWMAPFVASINSQLFRDHHDWFQKTNDGEPVLCGDFAHWGGKFYALDLELESVRSHLARIIKTMCQEWGVGFIKADFLYAAGRTAGGGLTRAARAARAHAWLFELCCAENALLLSCGAILSSAIGLCHFCRIGADVGLSWSAANPEHNSREQVHTRASVENTITRYFLSQLAFGNDPDVFILRDRSCELSLAERQTLLLTNQLLGDLIFTSDYLEEYGEWQRQTLEAAQNLRNLSASNSDLLKSIQKIDENTYCLILKHAQARIHIGEHPSVEWTKN